MDKGRTELIDILRALASLKRVISGANCKLESMIDEISLVLAVGSSGERVPTKEALSLLSEGLGELDSVLKELVSDFDSAKNRALQLSDDETISNPLMDEELRQRLMEFRAIEARKAGHPSYCIFQNKTIDQIIELKPTTLNDLAEVWGIGETRVERFGYAVVDIVKKILEDEDLQISYGDTDESVGCETNPDVFSIDVNKDVFKPDELEWLQNNGNRYLELYDLRAAPATEEEKQVLRVWEEDLEPQSVAERAWKKYQFRKKFEAEGW